MNGDLKKELFCTVFHLKKTGAAIQGDSEAAAAHDINMAEIYMLNCVAAGQFNTDPSMVKETLCISKAAISQMLGVLEKKGYLTREINRENRRKIIVELTAKGKGVIEKNRKYIDRTMGHIIKRFGEKNTRLFIDLFNRFAEIAEDIK